MLSWLQSYYGGSDCCSWCLSSLRLISVFSLPLGLISRPVARSWYPSVSNWVVGKRIDPGQEQLSLLISFEFLTIPSPTTSSPFRRGRFRTLLHRLGLPCLSPGKASAGRWEFRRTVKGSDITRSLPDRLGRIEFAVATDWLFSSGCSPPFLTETQLPLSDSGR
jgi:hypothetical protein